MSGTRDPWNFGRFPMNLRPARYRRSRLCFASSLLGNAVLIVLIKMEKIPVMVPYSRVLLMNVAFDLFYTFVCIFTEVVRRLRDSIS
ncbi:hypothetical protein AAVH_29568 [Aphelenchoides avenae]|nr:hypothetical protein AAVH_29568 [Aphelenchus avenae]